MARALRQFGFAIALILAAPHPAPAENSPAVIPAEQASASAMALSQQTGSAAPAVRQLVAFRDSDVKFSIPELMNLLRDRRHEGWVLAAYPDPKTRRPLIGAGFSLDLPERPHAQPDPLNPHPFIEPSSAELWQAAGLAPDRLQRILSDYQDHLALWKAKKFRRRIAALAPEISDAEATALLRIAVLQAAINARAYCRNFDELSASQQMGLTQLVYQMGVNLEEFDRFLNLINDGSRAGTAEDVAPSGEPTDWRGVQQALMQSQWARLYRNRAVAVIAMLNPRYDDDPVMAEHQIAAKLRPAVERHRRHSRRAAMRRASWTRTHAGSRRSGHGARKAKRGVRTSSRV